jgi:hypothetical protein
MSSNHNLTTNKSESTPGRTRLAVGLSAKKAKTFHLLLCSVAVLLQFSAPARSQTCPFTV